MATARELLALAERSEREAARLEALARTQRDQAATLRQLAAAPESRLPSMNEDRSMLSSKMEQQSEGVNKRVRIARTMTEEASKAKKALLDAGLTPQDVADARGVGRSTVDAWCRGTRSIPKPHREWLEKVHGIPAKVWKNQA